MEGNMEEDAELSRLAGKIHVQQIREYAKRLKQDSSLQGKLCLLLNDGNPQVAINAAWILTHIGNKECQCLQPHYHELVYVAMRTGNTSLRRLVLTVIYRLSFPKTPHIEFLNFCLKEMMSGKQPYGIRSLCMKIAYEISLPFPEIRDEFAVLMEIMEPDLLPSSLRCTRKNIRKALRTNKSLRSTYTLL